MKKILILLSLLALPALNAEVMTLILPPETAVLKPGNGAQMAKAQCLTCHSADYISMQPLKGMDFWKAEVQKMKDKYGAPIPSDQMDELSAYLTGTYGTGVPAAGGCRQFGRSLDGRAGHGPKMGLPKLPQGRCKICRPRLQGRCGKVSRQSGGPGTSLPSDYTRRLSTMGRNFNAGIRSIYARSKSTRWRIGSSTRSRRCLADPEAFDQGQNHHRDDQGHDQAGKEWL